MIQSLQFLALVLSAVWMVGLPIVAVVVNLLASAYGNGGFKWNRRRYVILGLWSVTPFLAAVVWAVLV